MSKMHFNKRALTSCSQRRWDSMKAEDSEDDAYFLGKADQVDMLSHLIYFPPTDISFFFLSVKPSNEDGSDERG